MGGTFVNILLQKRLSRLAFLVSVRKTRSAGWISNIKHLFNERTSYFAFNFNPVVLLCVMVFHESNFDDQRKPSDVDVHAKTFLPMNFHMMKFSRSPISA